MAYHEASHTICAFHNFMCVDRVYIMSDKVHHGKTLYELLDFTNVKSKVLAKILIIFEVQTYYAGLVGEKIYYKDICGSDKFPMNLRIGSSFDIKSSYNLINKNNLAEPGKSRLLFKKQVQNDTRAILLEYWEDVKLIAHLLYKHKELNFDNLKYYLTRNSVNKKFWKERFKCIKLLLNQNIEEKDIKEIITNNSVIIM